MPILAIFGLMLLLWFVAEWLSSRLDEKEYREYMSCIESLRVMNDNVAELRKSRIESEERGGW